MTGVMTTMTGATATGTVVTTPLPGKETRIVEEAASGGMILPRLAATIHPKTEKKF